MADETAQSAKRRKNDPEGVRANIIMVASREFAEHGLAGARIDEIASKTKTSKRMIYYYFTDKQGLYQRVLEEAYSRVRDGEAQLRLDHLAPVEAMRTLVAFTVAHHRENPDFVRMVMIENIHRAAHLRESKTIGASNSRAIEHLDRIYRAGVEAGVFRAGLEPIDIHWMISALAFFNVSNRATFSTVFDWRPAGGAGERAISDQIVDAVLRFVLTPEQIAGICG